MSYHNGSVWPHDTALCAMGLSRYGDRDGAARITAALFEAAVQMDMRLPELFCGFPRSAGEPPVPYPVACMPQAWAAGSVFMLLQACLGVTVDGAAHEVRIRDPHLPVGIDHLRIDNLAVGDARVSLKFDRAGRLVHVKSHTADPTIRVRRR
ncbi:hypothetical protein [Phenylobacterium sp. J367]|uniref:hypothetical protein n=1 Tax=Phenylobacterium sp. J367 TaxID=2898435 RepID=UPI002150CF50|nr:hypothetical protein [Phenylobacterium sp. J367]MCR5877936.1 hypothetical protein [Phenylobacterium sp. J367]